LIKTSSIMLTILMVLSLAVNVSAYTNYEELYSPSQSLVSYLFQSIESVPSELVSENTEDPDAILESIISDFNLRYGYNLSSPEIVFINESNGKYFDNIIYIPSNSANPKYTISHEACHYFQDKVVHFEAFGESFCEVFAGADRSKEECLEKGWPQHYCAPFRLSEVDRDAFVDCVFEDISYGGASKEELLQCYSKNKV